MERKNKNRLQLILTRTRTVGMYLHRLNIALVLATLECIHLFVQHVGGEIAGAGRCIPYALPVMPSLRLDYPSPQIAKHSYRQIYDRASTSMCAHCNSSQRICATHTSGYYYYYYLRMMIQMMDVFIAMTTIQVCSTIV